MNEIIKNYEQTQIQQILKNSKVTDFGPGDTVKVNVKIKEGNKERVQAFQGVCIGKKNNGLNSSFSVRKISSGEGVERVFPLYSNVIDSIERIKVGDVRRAKLYYLRELSGKKAREKMHKILEALYNEKKILNHGMEVGKELAYVLSGGDTDLDKVVTEDQMYKLELNSFMKLVDNKKTQDRIVHTLKTGKPLIN